MPKGTVHTLRTQPDLLEWVNEYAQDKGLNRNRLTNELYKALRQKRLFVTPEEGPNPFPGDEPVFTPPPTTE